MKSKFDSVCSECKEPIKKGEEIENKNNHWIHAVCPSPKTETPGKSKKVEEKKPSQEKPELKKANEIKPKTPHEEAEILVRWARDRAYKITHSEVVDLNSMNSEQIRNLNIETNMLTKILVQSVIKIYEISNIKLEY